MPGVHKAFHFTARTAPKVKAGGAPRRCVRYGYGQDDRKGETTMKRIIAAAMMLLTAVGIVHAATPAGGKRPELAPKVRAALDNVRDTKA